MTTEKLNDRLVRGDVFNHFTTLHFILLSMMLGVAENTVEADRKFLALVREEKEKGIHWKFLPKAEKQRKAIEIAKQLEKSKFKKIPTTSIIIFRTNQAMKQVIYYDERSEFNSWITGDLTLKQMARVAELLTQNPKAKISVGTDGIVRIKREIK